MLNPSIQHHDKTALDPNTMTSARDGIVETMRRWTAVDIAIAVYTTLTAILISFRHSLIPEANTLLVFHALVLFVVATLPPRGARWESTPRVSWKKTGRDIARFLRYTYPLALVIYFFEEVAHTVNVVAPAAPYWFEPYLYAADRWLFGELPTLLLAGWTGLVQDELIHFFYFSYYLIVVGGAVIAWFGINGTGKSQPGPGIETAMTTTVLAYFFSFIWYPLLPARGPWENPEVMAGLTPFQGVVFTPLMEWIIGKGAVSGGCFPSSHVSGAWGMVLGLARFHRRPALILGIFAAGMSFACIYTRYHHAVDIPAGFLMAVVAALIAYRITPGKSER